MFKENFYFALDCTKVIKGFTQTLAFETVSETITHSRVGIIEVAGIQKEPKNIKDKGYVCLVI